MFCPKCGTKNANIDTFCVNCGKKLSYNPTKTVNHQDYSGKQPAQALPGGREIPDLTIFSIFVTILCCIPLGLFALYFSAKARGLVEAGDRDKAYETSRLALIWCWTSFIAGLAFYIFYIFAFIAGYVNTAPSIF